MTRTSDGSAARLLCSSARGRASGVFEARRGPDHLEIHFRDGSVAFAATSRPELRLGQLLRRAGALSEDELLEALRQADRRHALLGATLVETGVLSAARVALALRGQIEEITLAALSGTTPDIEFRPRTSEPRGYSNLNLGLANLAVEAARRGQLPWVEGKPPDDDSVYRLAHSGADLLRALRLASDERRFLSNTDGRSRFSEIVTLSGLAREEAARILNGFLQLGLVEFWQNVAGDPSVELPEDLPSMLRK